MPNHKNPTLYNQLTEVGKDALKGKPPGAVPSFIEIL
jgi:hypothetical protein